MIWEKAKGDVMINKFLFLVVVLSLSSLSFAATLYPITPTSNALYQNNNATNLYIYARGPGGIKGYLGATANTLVEISNYSAPQTVHRDTALLIVPPKYYWKLNYTQPVVAYALYSPDPPIMVTIPTASINTYSSTALLFFILGIILSLFTILSAFNIIKIQGTFVYSVVLFALAFLAATFLLFSITTTNTLSSNSYTITTGNQIITVNSTSATTIPLGKIAIIALIAELLSIVDMILGFILLFLALIVYNESRKKKRKAQSDR